MAEYERCTGCQSFCMQGYQLAGTVPEKSNSYPDTWKQWRNIKSYTENSDTSVSTIQQSTTLSAQSQNDLIQFIKDTYSEGKYNPEDGNIFQDWSGSGKVTIDSKTTTPISSTSLSEASCSSKDIIYAKHYNNLLEPLIDFYSPIIVDPNGEPLQNNNNATESGPVAGWPGSKTILVTSGQTDSSDSSLIKASLYNEEGLYAKASKLMYHPYQCNICNIYEGGEWLEIVDEMWRNLRTDAPDVGWIYYDHSGSQKFATMRAGGGEVSGARLDCSGCVSAAITLYSIATGQGSDTACQGTYTTHYMGANWSDPPKLGFTWFDGNGPWQAGDIQVCIQHHTQIVDENVNLAYSGGGDTGLNAGGPSSELSNYEYDGGWRFNGDPGTASGDGSGGIVDDGDTEGYISTGCTVYGNTIDDDNGTVGWASVPTPYYANYTGCHVAIPMGMLGSTWHYGDLVKLKYNGRSCTAVVADCGNFGSTGTYNHFAMFDLPPNTQKALNIYDSVTSGLLYKRAGHINYWDGSPL